MGRRGRESPPIHWRDESYPAVISVWPTIILSNDIYYMTMPKVFRYRLKPTKPQVAILNRQLDLCRWTYNQTLALRKNAWESEDRSISYFESKRMLPIWKESKPQLSEVYSQVLQEAVQRVDLAFKSFFRRVKAGEEPGYPRFKGRNWYDSLTYPQSGFAFKDNVLHLSKIGDLKVWLHRKVEGTIKRLTIRRSATNKWYVSFLSDGIFIENQRYLAAYEGRLATAQSKKDKLPHKSPERRKAAKKVGHIYEKLSNLRDNFAHRLSHQIVNDYGIICLEDIDIKSLIEKKPYLAKSVLDASWNRFRTYVTYKAESAGRKMVLINPAYTSQMCSGCGTIVPKDLSERVHNCPKCGLVMDRDLNASKNILRLGLQSVAKA